MSEALSGFENGENGEKKQARHSQFMGALLEKTSKIQREMRGRRYKVRARVLCYSHFLSRELSSHLCLAVFRKYKVSYRMLWIR